MKKLCLLSLVMFLFGGASSAQVLSSSYEKGWDASLGMSAWSTEDLSAQYQGGQTNNLEELQYNEKSYGKNRILFNFQVAGFWGPLQMSLQQRVSLPQVSQYGLYKTEKIGSSFTSTSDEQNKDMAFLHDLDLRIAYRYYRYGRRAHFQWLSGFQYIAISGLEKLQLNVNKGIVYLGFAFEPQFYIIPKINISIPFELRMGQDITALKEVNGFLSFDNIFFEASIGNRYFWEPNGFYLLAKFSLRVFNIDNLSSSIGNKSVLPVGLGLYQFEKSSLSLFDMRLEVSAGYTFKTPQYNKEGSK